MEQHCFIIISVLLLQVHNSYEDCRVLQSPQGLQNYWCNTIQELESTGNPQLLDVSIYNGKTLPLLSNQTHQRKPNLQIFLTDDAVDSISSTTFQILKELSKVFLKSNQVKTISKGVFENLPIQKLRLNNNGIQSIQVGAFSNMQQLEELYITNNNLRNIETGIFNSLSVETLGLSNNKISAIRRNALYNMKNLKHLHLDGNSLTEFRPDTFISYGSKLETLFLQDNYLADIDRNSVKTLDNLKILNLAGNGLTKIIIYAFENLLKLEELVLSSNHIRELDPDIFAADGMANLIKLQINENQLSFITPKFLGRLSNLKYMRLGGNPWVCPCFDAIVKWLADNNIVQFCDYDYYTGTKPVCVVPDVRTTTCDYLLTSSQYISKYTETIAISPANKICSF